MMVPLVLTRRIDLASVLAGGSRVGRSAGEGRRRFCNDLEKRSGFTGAIRARRLQLLGPCSNPHHSVNSHPPHVGGLLRFWQCRPSRHHEDRNR